ncbi:FimV/HubP family polar landmark protein [Undibacterium seohonense]|nr:FimV/HubP family polar landmark protein [Undibacterium seohonense]
MQFAPTAAAQQNSNELELKNTSSSVQSTNEQSDLNTSLSNAQRKQLQQELHSLLAENKRINQEKIQYLESQSQRVFWTQCLIGFLIIAMLISLFSFWRLHVQHKFQTGLDSLTTSLRNFQDSIFSLSFIDTSGYSTAGNSSSFHISQTDLDQLDKHSSLSNQVNSRLNSQLNTQPNSQLNSGFHRTLNPNTTGRGDEFSDIRGFFDAWLNVYNPGDPRYEEALAAATKPNSAKPWLQMLDNFRQSSDHSGFENIRKEIKKFFNIKINPLEARNNADQKQLSDFPHIVQKILDLWPTDEVVIYLERLMHNSRMSPREGFDVNMFQQLESLLELANRPDRPRQVQQLKRIGIADFLFKTNKNDSAVKNTKAAPSIVSATAPQVTVTAVEPVNTSNPQVKESVDQPIPATSTANVLKPNIMTAVVAATAEPAVTTTKPVVHTSNRAPVTPAVEVDEKTRYTANEVRLKLATAYLDIADTEGACLLLEDVIKEAVPAQQAHAQRLLKEIEAKQARTCDDNEKIYFH